MSLHRFGLLVSITTSVALVACGDDSSTAGSGGMGGGPGGSGGAGGGPGGSGAGGGTPLAWEPCEVFEEYPPLKDTATQPGECTTVSMPLDWDAPEGATLEVFVKRVRSSITPPTRQVWLLNGGPGAASKEFDPVLLRWANAIPGLEVYTTDFRGAGLSTPLPCDDFQIAPGSVDGCAAKVASEIGDINAFTTTQAARDVIELVERTRGDAPVALYGLSFGTFWAHRVLQLEPDLFAGAVLDSIAPPEADFSLYSPNADQVAQDFFARCALDTTCSSKLGTEPWAQVEAFFALPANSACPGSGLSQGEWKGFLAQAIRKVQTRPLVPALIYRMLRCAPEDEDAIAHLLDYVGSLPADPVGAFHIPLYAHIVLSELWDLTPLSVAEYAASDQSLLIAPGNTDYLQALWEEWPRTPEDGLANQTAAPNSPVLLLQGGLDPQTSKLAADPFASDMVAQGHSYVVFPDAPHAVIGQTPISGDPTAQCADLLVRAFIADPSVTSHTCQAELAPLDFGDNVELAAEALGTGSIWENVPVPAGLTAPSSTRRDLRQALAQLAGHNFAR